MRSQQAAIGGTWVPSSFKSALIAPWRSSGQLHFLHAPFAEVDAVNAP
jgi:hypothetical protein